MKFPIYLWFGITNPKQRCSSKFAISKPNKKDFKSYYSSCGEFYGLRKSYRGLEET